VPVRANFYYRKWLKYYLDFCLKYHHEKSKKESLPHFFQKLKDKSQTEEQRKQAFHAGSIFLELKNTDQDNMKTLKNNKEIISRKKEDLKSTKADWKPVHKKFGHRYTQMNTNSKSGHYSPKTLKSYRGWVRQFQNFTKSKDPRLLSTPEVKDFLAHLAVERQVAASTQNQAFNALLFFTDIS